MKPQNTQNVQMKKYNKEWGPKHLSGFSFCAFCGFLIFDKVGET
jgi:hypothetical protein